MFLQESKPFYSRKSITILMPEALNFLASRSNHDLPTNYVHYYSGKVISQAQAMGYNTTDLSANQATKQNLGNSLPIDPLFYFGVGHGSYTKFSGQNLEILLEKGINENWMANRIVFLLACETGRDLGPAMIANGAKAFIGWKERFWWVVAPPYIPAIDPYAKGFLETANLIAQGLINGNPIGKVHADAIASFRKWIKHWEQSSDETASLVISGLLDNIDNLVLYGDTNAFVNSVLSIF